MAGALVGGAFLSASLQVLFDRMASRQFINFFRESKHDDRPLKKLKITLLALNSVIGDAEDKQITNPAVQDWLDELKDAVYHADDLLDEINTEALRCKLEADHQQSRNPVKSLFSDSGHIVHEDIESKIDVIVDRLQYFIQQKDVLGLKEGVGRKQSERLPTTSLVDGSGVYGRDKDIDNIMKLLLFDDAHDTGACVIPVVGMGGVGKTTLAQVAYNNEKVEKHFDIKAWVCVSEEFDVFRVTKTILVAVTSSALDVDDLNLLQVKLRESIRGKKFLIVLDDVWNENYNDWDTLTSPFRDGACGSKIIVTTRNESVALVTGTVPTLHLELLSDDDCWSLFAKHAFGYGNPSAHPNLEVIGKDIVKKCKGLPLAAKTLGGVLRSKSEVDEWDNILKSAIWDLPNSKSNILPALRLSYHYLPSHLKQCFASCAIYPKDYVFEEEKLVLLWMAKGLIQQPKSDKRIEEIGEEYFRELISRSFLQPSSDNKFLMHDLVNDLAQFVSGEFCFRLDDDKPQDISEKARHFSYVRGKYDAFDKFKAVNEVKCLRTFLPLNVPSNYHYDYFVLYLSKQVLDDILPTLTCLRVLSLSHYEIIELPHSIGNLKHLRYLDLSSTKIRRLPDSLSTLYNLQTMLLSNCRFLTELPLDMGELINLRHLDIRGTNLREMPIQLGRLKSLQRLTTFIVGKHSGSRITELKEHYHLRGALSILGLQHLTNSVDALGANLKEKKHLQELVLEWRGNTDDSQTEREILDKLKPHTNLKKLIIKNYGGTRFPDWLGDHSFSNIVSLSLQGCTHCFSLPPLGLLPSVKELNISVMNAITQVGPEFYGNYSLIKSFQSLEILKFEEMLEWEEWYVPGAGEFSCLRELYIINCPKLTGDLPDRITSIKTLKIAGCQQLAGSRPDGRIMSNQVGLLQQLSSLKNLKISDMSNLKELPVDLCGLTNLLKLTIEGCPSLVSFPDKGFPSTLVSLKVRKCDALLSLPEGMSCINTSLKEILISGCPSLVSFPRGGLPNILKSLFILDCEKLELPLDEEMDHCYTSLEWLSISNSCDFLKSLPLGLFPKLQYLCITGCTNLETLLIPMGSTLISLVHLEIQACSNIVSFAKGGLPAPNLTYFKVCDCQNLKFLPERMHTLFPSLQSLYIYACRKIESFPEGGLPSNLMSVYIDGCQKLMASRMEWGLQRLLSLRELRMDGGCEDVLESFPEEWLLPTTLTTLVISGLPNLVSLNHKGLQHLNSLHTLHISKCPRLRCLPEEGLPTHLSLLKIEDCPLLNLRCQRKKGEDWPKIAQIHCIKLDREVIL